MVREESDSLIVRIRKKMIRLTGKGIRSSKDSRGAWYMLKLKIVFGKEEVPPCLAASKVLGGTEEG